jgi:hypothetical protein
LAGYQAIRLAGWQIVGSFLALASFTTTGHAAPPEPKLNPVVDLEEEVYSFKPADNGAGPMWCSGSTCLVRSGHTVFASGIETLKDAKPLNNCRWLLFHRGPSGWEQIAADPTGRTREPSPVVAFTDSIFLSANPTLVPDPNTYSGPAQPEILQFSTADPKRPFQRLLPVWEDNPRFTEHSYRSFAADGLNRELILFQNIDYTHSEWAFRESSGQWIAHGKLRWPWGAEYDKPEPIRVCYADVMLRNRAVYFCGVSDVVEPYEKWRSFKKELTGQAWDYDFRRLFYTWTDDITGGKFHDWMEIASRDKTCGWISPGDLWVDPDSAVHIVWSERAIDERLRDKFFPGQKQSHALNYAILRNGKITLRRTLVLAEEGKSKEVPSFPRFQVTPENRLFVIYYISGIDTTGKPLSENRLIELQPDGSISQPITIALQHPLSSYFNATVRAGSPPAKTLDLLGQRADSSSSICYTRISLFP